MPATPTADPRILHPLDRLRGLVRRFVVLDGLLAAALFLVAWFWAGLALDFGLFKLATFDWVLDAPRLLRAAALAVFLALVVAVVTRRVVLRLTRELSYPSLALVLEKRFPDVLGDRLITAVELADVARAADQGYSREMVEDTIATAREKVGTVPVRDVFNWPMLWRKLVVIVAVMVVMLLGSFAVFSGVTKTVAPGEFAWRFGDVATIWAERNLFLMQTPWPRRAHLELVDFPEKELRVGKDAPPPKVRVRAYEWVLADRSAREGWRPLRWADLTPRLVGADVPATVSVPDDGDWPHDQTARAALVGAVGLPGERPVATRTVALADLTADEVASRYTATHTDVAIVFDRLTTLAAGPSMSRTLRKLDAPASVLLTYRGRPFDYGAAGKVDGNTRGEFKLTREPTGEFSAEVTGLKEPVTFVVRAEDFRTAPRDIFLVPPPMLIRLTHTDAEPAYLHHPAPQGAAFGALKGLRQTIAEKDLSLTGEKSVCPARVGTELVLTATADKPLAKVWVQPRTGKAPGGSLGSSAPIPVPVTGDTFAVRFVGDDRVTQGVEFELVMEDFDGVRASRPVVVQAADDQAPQVELAVDVLRKVGNTYLCTPLARVPFVKESLVRDDTGLSKVEYQFTVTRLEAQVVVGLQAQAVASVWAFAPLIPNLGTALGATAGTTVAGQLGSGGQKQFGALAVPAYDQAYSGIPKDTLDVLKAKLATPLAAAEFGRVVKEVKFAFDTDVFDMERVDEVLEKSGKRMKVSQPGEIQARFRIEMEVVATDVNYETGPKVGRNLEPVRLLVVSEADLLAEISKDEEALIGKLDDALRKLNDGNSKLIQQTDRLISPEPPADVLLSAKVRAEDILQDVGKGRDNTQVVAGEYGRLRREVDTNRVSEERDANGVPSSKVGRRYQDEIIAPLEAVLGQEFKAAEDALAAFRDPLLDGRRPDDAAMVNARTQVKLLIDKLTAIRVKLGEALSINKLRDDLRKILENRQLVSAALEGIKKRLIGSLFAPRLGGAGPLTLARGETAKVRHTLAWELFDKEELKLTIQVPAGSGLTAPAELTMKADPASPTTTVEYELKAGDKPGDYTLKVIPAVGDPVEVKVTVK